MVLLTAGPSTAHASSCCAAGSIAPTILTTDDRAQISATMIQSQVIGDAPAQGIPVFRADGDDEELQSLRLDGAILVTDRWQLGASIPFTRRARSSSSLESSSSGVGDIALNATYEILPEWEYSAWKPKGYAFAQGLIPTGGSIHEASFSASNPWGLDARGRGFFAAGAGVLLVKTWGDWDASVMTEAHRAFARSFDTTEGALLLAPGWGASLAAAAGYSLRGLPLRLGLSLSPGYESAVRAKLVDQPESLSTRQLVWNTSAQVGWMVSPAATLSARYTDQTLLGPATNVSLSRSLALLYQQRWER